MSLFTRQFATALASKLQSEGYRLFIVLGVRDTEEDIDVTVVGTGDQDDIDDLEEALADVMDQLRENIAFVKPRGSA